MGTPPIQPPELEPDSGPATDPPPQGRRRWRVWRTLLISLALFLLAVGLIGQYFLQDARLARLLREQLSAALQTSVDLQVRRSGWHRFEVLELAIGGDSRTPPFLQIERLGVYPRPGRLWDKRLHLDSLVVQGLRVNLSWQDSLLLPAWLGLDDSTAVEDNSGTDPLEYLRLLADKGWRVDSTRIILRDLRVGLSGQQGGRPLDLDSPPLGLTLRLPELDPAALRALAQGELPPRVLASMLLAWSGDWRERASGSGTETGAGLRPLPLPPDTRETLRLAGLELERSPEILQGLDLSAELVRDTLRLGVQLEARPRDLALRWESRRLPLPTYLLTRLELTWPVRENPLQAQLGFELELSGPGLATTARATARLVQQSPGWSLRADWSQSLKSRLAELDPLGRALELPALGGDLALDLTGSLQLEVDSTLSGGTGRYRETLVATAGRLELPESGLAVVDLQIKQTLRADLDLADPLPSQPELDLTGRVGRLELGLAPLDDPRDLDLALHIRGRGSRDSLDLTGELSMAHWQQGRLDLSLSGRLPSLTEWSEDCQSWLDQPERFQQLPLVLDLETSQLSLDGLDASLAGGLRTSAQVRCGQGLDFWLEAVPGGLQVNAAGQRLDVPLHRLLLEGHAWLGPLDNPIPWPDTLVVELRPDPLPPMTLQLGRQGQQARLLQSWKGFDLPRLLAMLPPAWQPADVDLKTGRAFLECDLLLGADGLPLGGTAGLGVNGVRAEVPGYGVEELELRLDLALDSLGVDYVLAGAGEALNMHDPVWSWEGLSLAGSGRVQAPLTRILADSLWLEPGRGGAWPADLTLELGLRSLNLSAQLTASLADWRNQRPDEARLVLFMGGAGQLRPWPGLRLTGKLGLEESFTNLGQGRYHTRGRLHARLDSLAWQGSAALEELALDLPFEQVLTLEPVFGLESDRRRSPLDWSGLRAWDRRQPEFEERSVARREGRDGEGWALHVAKARYDNWSLEALMVDLRPGQGRLDIPEFRFNLFGGGVRGSAAVVGLDSTRYALDCALIGLDSRYFEFGDRLGGGKGRKGRKGGLVHAVLNLEGQGLDLQALDQLRGQLRMPDLDREVTLNLLRALDAQGVDPSIGRIRRLLELPGFRYRVERVEFDVAHGFARPRVSLRKSPFSPLPDVAIPMSPLPLGFMVRNFALAGEETP